MLNPKDIRFLTPEERAGAADRRREKETLIYQKRLALLDEWPLDQRPPNCGRLPLVLRPEVAQRVLDDVAAGASLRAIEEKYRAVGYSFSRSANNQAAGLMNGGGAAGRRGGGGRRRRDEEEDERGYRRPVIQVVLEG